MSAGMKKTLLFVTGAGETARQISAVKSLSYQISGRVKTAEEARNLLARNQYDAVLINSPLPDEPGDLLAVFAAKKGATVLLLTEPEDFSRVCATVECSGVFPLEKPVSKAVFTQVLRLMSVFDNRLHNLKTEKERQMRQRLEEVQIISRAKCILVEYLRMNEDQAHKYIERQAMDMQQSKRQIAEDILKTYE